MNREEIAEWVGYYFGLQRAYNKGPHTRILDELRQEMEAVENRLPPGTIDAWPVDALKEIWATSKSGTC